jgi:putative hemin transport protein
LGRRGILHAFDKAKLQSLLETAAKSELPIMIFAGNKDNLQIHQDLVRTIRIMTNGSMYLILDSICT